MLMKVKVNVARKIHLLAFPSINVSTAKTITLGKVAVFCRKKAIFCRIALPLLPLSVKFNQK